MKKILSLLLVVAMVLGLVACAGESEDTFKVGFIFLHDENSTYDNNFMMAAKQVQQELGLSDDQVIFKTNIPEDNTCYDTAMKLVDEGCDVIFADSFGHESFMLQAAKECPEVQFCHATGTQAKVAGLANYHNAFASIYEGRYLAGIAAGLKLNEMISSGKITAAQAKIGYVGAWPYAEVKSGYTSFYLGAKSVCESVTMDVTFTNSWFDISLEKEAAENLIKDGCVLISQHADSEGAPKACEAASVPNVAYNISTISMAPTTAIISSKIDWAPYFKLMIESARDGKEIPTDYCGTIETGSVALTELNTAAAAEGTQEAIDAAMAKLKSGEIHVFDTSKFTVSGAALTEYAADINGDYKPDEGVNVIKDGYFNESDAEAYRSAPYFDVDIDGITIK
ncbi:MAG: BMP family ABC transporter substrate-binding protein [Clostridia bacterium]|nr:BMP family ABC transporter substrate-binding protein [Clostridia bacterium]